MVKLLIVNLMQIGDLVLTTPVFRALRLAFPNAFIAVAVNIAFADLVRFNPFINQLFEVDKSSFKSLFVIIRRIRSEHFDLTINLNRSERACAIAALSGAKRIVGYSKLPFSCAFDTVCPNLKRSTHQIISHFNVLQCAGLGNLTIPQSDVFIPDNIQNDINSFWRQHFKPSDKVIAFNVGASWPSKRWLPHFFALLANYLSERGFSIAFLGSKSDFHIVNLCSNLISFPCHIFTGQFNLLQLAAFFDHCHLLISNDSGPLHIAAARNLPALAFFGSSPTIGFFPWLHSHAIIKSPAPCHPCYKHSCPLNGESFMQCMKLITPDIALKYALELLSVFDKPAKDLPHIQGAYNCKIIDLAKQN